MPLNKETSGYCKGIDSRRIQKNSSDEDQIKLHLLTTDYFVIGQKLQRYVKNIFPFIDEAYYTLTTSSAGRKDPSPEKVWQ